MCFISLKNKSHGPLGKLVKAVMEIFVDVNFVPARTGKTPPVRVDMSYDLKTAQVC